MKTWRCCRINLMQWRLQPKFAICLIYLVLDMWDLFQGFQDYAAAVGGPVAVWLLPLLPGAQNRYVLILLAFVMLISDAPFRNRQQQFVLQRTGKALWIRGQLLYLLMLSALFTLALWVLTWVFLLPQVSFAPEWGTVLQTAARYPHAYEVFLPVTVSMDILNGCTGLEATLWTICTQTLVCTLLGEIVMLCNLWCKRGVGVAVAVGLIMISYCIRLMSSAVGVFRFFSWGSPVSWADRSMMGHVNQNLPSFTYGILMSLGLCVLLGVALMATIHRCNLETDKE